MVVDLASPIANHVEVADAEVHASQSTANFTPTIRTSDGYGLVQSALHQDRSILTLYSF